MSGQMNGGIARRRSSSQHLNPRPDMFKFPELTTDHDEHAIDDISRGSSPKPLPNGLPVGLHSSERWPPRQNRSPSWRSAWAHGGPVAGMRHGRQKSLSEAIRTVRARRASISENAQEIAESLKAPLSWKLVTLCCFWYATSMFSNTSSKEILTALNMPTTLTIAQFAIVAVWCFFVSWLSKRNASIRNNIPALRNGIRRPTKETMHATLPLTAFMISGHILNYLGMAKIPVSLVHTIKGLSPLMTVFAYRVFYDIRYSTPTYLSLIPLTLGVIMACAADSQAKANTVGLMYAFASAVIFVTQNIVSKQIFNDSAKAEQDGTPINRRSKPDKLNLLCYSSVTAFALTLPIWIWSEGLVMAQDFFADSSITLSNKPGAFDHGRLALEFLVNGTFHFAQSLVAFILLGMVSPVTYSVASLIKRVAVIVWAILWFGTPMTKIQGFGIALTFLGLYLYDRTHSSSKADKRAKHIGEDGDRLLPLSTGDTKKSDPPLSFAASPMAAEDVGAPFAGGGGYQGPSSERPRPRSASRSFGNGDGSNGGKMNGNGYGLLPGTKASETWNYGDARGQQSAAVP